MGNRTKVTYTLDRNVIDYIKTKSQSLSITHSRFVAESILSGYEMLLEGYDENDQKPIVGVARKRSHTIPITLSLPTDVVETLNWFSRILNVKKSHLVRCCIRKREDEEYEPFYKIVREFEEYIERHKKSPT
jgi:hypothetical protein